MTLDEAIKLLGLSREGGQVPEEVVTEALITTGELQVVESPCPAVEAWVEQLRSKGLL